MPKSLRRNDLEKKIRRDSVYARQENFVGEEKKHQEKDDILTEVKVAKRSKVEKEGENS